MYAFHSKLLLDSCASFTSSRVKDLMCQKWKDQEGKTNFFRGAYRLSGTGLFRPTPLLQGLVLVIWSSGLCIVPAARLLNYYKPCCL